jgi:hypothetical protein
MKRPLETRHPARNRGLGKDQEVSCAHARPECPAAPQKRPREAGPVDFVYENENWNDESLDDNQSKGMALIRQGQGNSLAVLQGRLSAGDWLLPNEMVAMGSYQSISVGCDELYAHFSPNRGGLLGYFAGPEKPPKTMWLKPGVEVPGFPQITKEGLSEADGSVWEHGGSPRRPMGALRSNWSS